MAMTVQRWPKLSPMERVADAKHRQTAAGLLIISLHRNGDISDEMFADLKKRIVKIDGILSRAQGLAGSLDNEGVDAALIEFEREHHDLLRVPRINPSVIPNYNGKRGKR